MEFPRSCVIYLRSTKNTPDVEEVELLLPDGQVCVYRVPTVKVERYTKDSIFEKNLLMLLPFYVMRYEESAHIIGEDSEKLRRLLNNCASHYSYCGVDSSDLCAHMLQNDRKEEFLRMTIRKMYDMMNL